ncbi:MAG TPA: hypothetical protein VEX60_18850 [Pyrinomonadaceae bacterium]|nr:hypothetical protein [Pyrinomonadaceae bacterium]
MKTLALSLFCALALSACGAHHDTSDALPLGTHKVSVRPRCVSKHIHNDEDTGGKTYNLTCGDTKVTIKYEALIVNGKSYGMLSKGDSVHVEDGKVFVNDRPTEEVRK